jgi:hypothetical protein
MRLHVDVDWIEQIHAEDVVLELLARRIAARGKRTRRLACELGYAPRGREARIAHLPRRRQVASREARMRPVGRELHIVLPRARHKVERLQPDDFHRK